MMVNVEQVLAIDTSRHLGFGPSGSCVQGLELNIAEQSGGCYVNCGDQNRELSFGPVTVRLRACKSSSHMQGPSPAELNAQMIQYWQLAPTV